MTVPRTLTTIMNWWLYGDLHLWLAHSLTSATPWDDIPWQPVQAAHPSHENHLW